MDEQLGEKISVNVVCLPLLDEEDDELREALLVEADRGEEELIELLEDLWVLPPPRPTGGVCDGPASSVSPFWWRSW